MEEVKLLVLGSKIFNDYPSLEYWINYLAHEVYKDKAVSLVLHGLEDEIGVPMLTYSFALKHNILSYKYSSGTLLECDAALIFSIHNDMSMLALLKQLIGEHKDIPVYVVNIEA